MWVIVKAGHGSVKGASRDTFEDLGNNGGSDNLPRGLCPDEFYNRYWLDALCTSPQFGLCKTLKAGPDVLGMSRVTRENMLSKIVLYRYQAKR